MDAIECEVAAVLENHKFYFSPDAPAPISNFRSKKNAISNFCSSAWADPHRINIVPLTRFSTQPNHLALPVRHNSHDRRHDQPVDHDPYSEQPWSGCDEWGEYGEEEEAVEDYPQRLLRRRPSAARIGNFGGLPREGLRGKVFVNVRGGASA